MTRIESGTHIGNCIGLSLNLAVKHKESRMGLKLCKPNGNKLDKHHDLGSGRHLFAARAPGP